MGLFTHRQAMSETYRDGTKILRCETCQRALLSADGEPLIYLRQSVVIGALQSVRIHDLPELVEALELALGQPRLPLRSAAEISVGEAEAQTILLGATK